MERTDAPIYDQTREDWKERLTFPIPRKLGEVQTTETLLQEPLEQ